MTWVSDNATDLDPMDSGTRRGTRPVWPVNSLVISRDRARDRCLRCRARSVIRFHYQRPVQRTGSVHRKKGSHRLPFFFTLSCPQLFTHAHCLVILFHAPATLAADGPSSGDPSHAVADAVPETPSAFHARCPAGSVPGLRGGAIFSPVPLRPGGPSLLPVLHHRKAASENQPAARPARPARLGQEAASERAHLSSDPRVQDRAGAGRTPALRRGPDDPETPRSWKTVRTRRTCCFFWAWPPAGSPRSAGLSRTKNASQLLNVAVAAFRSILIRRPGSGARAPGTGPGLLSEAGGRSGSQTISSGPW